MDSNEKTESQHIAHNSVDVENRKIYWGDVNAGESGSDFAWDSVEETIRAIHYLEKQNSKPIELHMSSYGGETNEMLRLYDVIQSSSCQIKFIGGGKIMSSATFIMAGCDERFIYPNTSILLHKWSAGIYGTDVEHRIEAYHGEKLTNTLNQIYADNSTMPVEFWDDMTGRDLYLTAEEAITLGLADKIIPYKKRSAFRRNRNNNLSAKRDPKATKKLVKTLKERIQAVPKFKC